MTSLLPLVSLRVLLCLFLGSFAVPNSYAEKAAPFVFVPSKGEGLFPVALWLHGSRGYSPSGYFPGESARTLSVEK